jgi:vitamin B12 transporter
MKQVLLVFGLFFSAALAAQDSVAFTRDIPAVNIVSSVRYSVTGTRSDVPDSTLKRIYPAGTLADLLGTGGSLALKSYGPGSLSTVAVRGANSMQTPVVWNGINLQNINNNTVDLSLLPVFLFDYVAVEPGSSSAAWGSGAIGGVIKVNSWPRMFSFNGTRLNNPMFHAKIVNEFGSFGTLMNGVQIGFGRKNWYYDFKAYRQLAENNFTFHNRAVLGNPLDTMIHAQMIQQGFMASCAYMPEAIGHSFVFRLWVQDTHREIPPTMLQSQNESTQQDYALRAVIQHQYLKSGLTINSRVALIHEGLVYDAGFTTPLSNTNAWTLMAESELSNSTDHWKGKLWKSGTINGGLTGAWSSSEVTEFIDYHEQVRASAYAGFKKNLRAQDEFCLMFREEMIDGKFIEPVGSVWYYFSLRDKLALRACVSHNYRVPTFNDLYWFPGGNRDLKAETSWTEELTIETGLEKSHWKIHYAVTGYNRNVVNMITWIPLAAYWSPVNVAAVWSKGIEHRLRYEQRIGTCRTILLLNADYTRSTYEKTDDPDDVAIGKQLIYVPAWFGGASLTAEWKGFFLTYSQQYNDLRFTTRDHVEWLPAYSVGSAAVGFNSHSKSSKTLSDMNIFLRCNNITNVNYEAVAWRPMPGRTFTIGLTLAFARMFEPKSLPQ